MPWDIPLKFKEGDEFVAGGCGGRVLGVGRNRYHLKWYGHEGTSGLPYEVLDTVASKFRQPFKLGDSIAPPDGGCYQDERIVLSEDGGRLQYVRRTKGTINFDNMVYTGAGGDFELAR